MGSELYIIYSCIVPHVVTHSIITCFNDNVSPQMSLSVWIILTPEEVNIVSQSALRWISVPVYHHAASHWLQCYIASHWLQCLQCMLKNCPFRLSAKCILKFYFGGPLDLGHKCLGIKLKTQTSLQECVTRLEKHCPLAIPGQPVRAEATLPTQIEGNCMIHICKSDRNLS